MNEANPRSGSSTPEGAGAASPPDEHLPTTRLPPVSSPPVSRSARPSATPMSPSAPIAPTGEKEAPHSQPRPSFSPPALAVADADKAVKEVRLAKWSIGMACTGLGLALALAGLVVGVIVGLRGISTEDSPGASVEVALVLTRGVIVLGMLAFGSGLIFFGSRLLLGRDFSGMGAAERSR